MISVVIPVYNEAGCLSAHLAALTPVLQDVSPGDWEVVLVDDGSTDGTGAEIARLAAADPRVRGLTHARNQGKGAAVRTG
ncbi:MAG: glycosyltransferase family 2 protein, partial [Planctomycetes bacterium]|nr:glycosyltransferase family 2 protein [Planctomycetota bacterium]